MAEIAQLQATMPKYPITLVMKERATPRVTKIHRRGEYLRETDPVSGGVPSVLPQLPKDKPAMPMGGGGGGMGGMDF